MSLLFGSASQVKILSCSNCFGEIQTPKSSLLKLGTAEDNQSIRPRFCLDQFCQLCHFKKQKFRLKTETSNASSFYLKREICKVKYVNAESSVVFQFHR